MEYDYDLRNAFAGHTGLRTTDTQRGQAARSTVFAGLGLRSTAEHSHAAYVASVVQTHEYCRALDANYT
eukprot:2330285-Karenia_brevis.AAC.1